jgi:hypothetical protein
MQWDWPNRNHSAHCVLLLNRLPSSDIQFYKYHLSLCLTPIQINILIEYINNMDSTNDTTTCREQQVTSNSNHEQQKVNMVWTFVLPYSEHEGILTQLVSEFSRCYKRIANEPRHSRHATIKGRCSYILDGNLTCSRIFLFSKLTHCWYCI